MPNEQDGKLKFGRSYVYLDPDSLASTPDAATPGVWRVKSGVDNSGDPSIGVVNAVNTRTGNVTLTSADVGLANVNNTSDANKPVSTAQQTALNAKIDTSTANSTLLGITAKAADSELLDGLNSTSFIQTNTQFGGDVSGAYNSIVIADDSHNHVISNVDGLQSALDIKADLVGGLVPTNQLPAIAITEYLGSVSSQSALLALSGQKGDWAIRSDTSTTWIITGTTPSNIGSWTELQYPAAPVSSVNGATGTVVLGHSDVGAASTAQGTTADSAIQPGDNISQLTNNSGFISATLTDEEVQDIVGGMVSGNTESGITVTYQDTDGTIDFDVATQSDNNFTTVLKDKLDAIEVSATADQTASEIITSLLTVDGANSGLDSDLLDGQHGSYYLDYTNFTNTPTFENANKLDNLDSTQFLRSDAADVKTSGTLNFSDDVKLTLGTSDDLEIYHDGTNSYIDDTGTGNLIIGSANLQLTNVAHTENFITATDNGSVDLYYDAVKKFETTNTGATVTGTLTATAFSGAGGNVTGVNASQLNSQNAAYYLDYSNFSNTPTIPTNNNQLTNGAGYLTSPDGGDAITLDGLDSTDFLRSNADDTFTGELTVSGNLLLSDQVRIGNDAWIEDFDGANAIRVKGNTDSTQGYIAFGNRTEKLGCNNSATLSYDGNTIWNAGNDGSGSGLDADTVDGLNPKASSTASSIAVRDGSSDISLRTIKSTFADETTISGAVGYRINNSTDNSLRFCSDMSAVRSHIGANNASNLTTGTIPIARISGGAGTGLDADLLDGVQGSNYLRSDQNDTLSGNLTVNRLFLGGSSNGGFDYNSTQNTLEVLTTNGSTHSEFNANAFIPGSHNTKNLGSNAKRWATLHAQNVEIDGNTAWHAGNDGAASGLDADLLDGQHGSYYLNYNNLTNLPAGAGGADIGAGNSKAEIIDTGTDGRFIVTTEGSERLRIDSSGKLGLGTTSPGQKLSVAGSALLQQDDSFLQFRNTAGTSTGYIQGHSSYLDIQSGSGSSNTVRISTNATERLRINSSGNLGLGTSTFTAASSGRQILEINGTTGALINLDVGGTRKAYYFTDGTDVYNYNTANGNYIFGTNGGERLRIDSSGRLLVGTTTEGYATYGDNLTIADSGHCGVTIRSGTSSQGNIYFSDGSSGGSEEYEGIIQYLHDVDAMAFGVNNGSEMMRIDSSGRLGLGTISPTNNLDIAVDSNNEGIRISSSTNVFGKIDFHANRSGADAALGILDFNWNNTQVARIIGSTGTDTTNKDDGALQFHTAAAGNATEAMRIDSSGNLGIGTSSPVGKAYISGPNASTFGVAADAALNLAAANGAVVNRVVNLNFACVDSATNAVAAVGMKYTSQSGFGKGDLIFGTRSVTTDTAPTERMRLDSSGNLGLGTSSPATLLHLKSDTPYIRFEDDNDNQDWQIEARSFFGISDITNSGAFRFVIDAAGNTGMGTTSPSSYYANDLVVSCSAEGGITIDGPSTGQSYLAFADGTSGNARYRGYIAYNHATDSFKFATGASPAMEIDSSGRLLVGTSSTSAVSTLLLQNNSLGTSRQGVLLMARGQATPSDGAALGTLVFAASNHSPAVEINGRRDGGTWTAGSSQPTRIEFSTTADGASSPTERMRIDSSGKILVGTTTPGFASYGDALTIARTAHCGMTLRGGTTSDTEIFFADGTTGTARYSGGIRYAHSTDHMQFTVNAAERMRIDSSGRLLVGTSTVQAHANMDDLQVGNASGNRGITISSATTGYGTLAFGDSADNSGVDRYAGAIEYSHGSDSMALLTASTERMRINSSGVVTIGGNTAWHAGNDGSGSGLDADTVDGIQASSFLRSDAADTATGTLTVRDIKLAAGYHLQRSNHHSGHLEGSYNNVASNSYKSNPIYTIGSSYNPSDGALGDMYGIGYTHNNASFISGTGFSGWGMYVAADGDARVYLSGSNGTVASTGQHYVGSNVVWNAGNDGSGSGLDADALDGLGSGDFLRSNANDVLNGVLSYHSNTARLQFRNTSYNTYLYIGGWSSSNSAGISRIRCSNDNLHIDSGSNGNLHLNNYSSGNTYIRAQLAWHAGNDGAGSGLDADNLDGKTWNSSGKDLRGTEIYADNWFRNYHAGEGLYNQSTGCHFVSDGSEQWTIRDSGNSIRIEFKTNGSTRRGSVYADNGPAIGFLNSGNQWGLQYKSSDGNSPNLYFHEQGNETWTGNPGNDVGKIEYHSNRFYIVSGGNSTYVCQFRRNGSDVCRIENSGAIVSSSNITAYSDITLKTDIEVIPNALEKVQQLRGITYNRIDLDDGIRYAGVSAQEVEEVLPEVVQTGEDGIKSVAYGNIVSLLIEAMKEQQVQIDELKTLVNK